MLRTYRLLLAKGAFYSFRKSEISLVLRIINRNYNLKFSGLSVRAKNIYIYIYIEYTSCICGDKVLHIGRPFAPQTHTVSFCGRMGPQTALLHGNKDLTFFVVVVPRGPGN